MFSLRGFVAFIPCAFLLVVSGHGSEIINGKEVRPHSLPFMALLETSQPICGGTLIDSNWVLTSAHCKNIKTVLLGVHSIQDKGKENKFRQVRNVKKQIPHPYFNPQGKVNDLMLLQLDKPVMETEWVKVLKLNSAIKKPAASSGCLVAGWGTTNNLSNKMSDVLRSVNVTVIDRAKCNSPQYYNHNPVITQNMICAGSDGKNVADTCMGDSGGPIICKRVLVGVTSFGNRCGIKKKPGVYAFLTTDLLNWIKQAMKKSEI